MSIRRFRNALAGAGRIFDMSGYHNQALLMVFRRRAKRLTRPDSEALLSDWSAVGEDLGTAVTMFNAHHVQK